MARPWRRFRRVVVDGRVAQPPRELRRPRARTGRRRARCSWRRGGGGGRRRRGRRERLADGPELDLPDRLDHQADHRGGGDVARRRRQDRARRPRCAVATGAVVTVRRPHAGKPDRRRRAPRQTDHGRRSAHLPRRVWLPVRLHAAGGRTALRRDPEAQHGPQQVADDGRVAGRALSRPAAPSARGGVALQHMLGHPGCARRPRVRPFAARVPGRAPVRAARHERHRIRGPRQARATGSRASTSPAPRGTSSSPTAPAPTGAARLPSPPVPAGSSRPSTTGMPSHGWCSAAESSKADGCCRRRRCG